jgi:hypothetical protein
MMRNPSNLSRKLLSKWSALGISKGKKGGPLDLLKSLQDIAKYHSEIVLI